ncbi:2-C-methyl-D-erythritol 4-phosphate cytidylyltransferase [Paenibacillus yanchengensis]|uniref:2-C-methyl-D-erythritol 4-phosphate cytidylyltransferase n=1 Tax=Paenibacillus yanchengensis TaxID=2035833 RepID=A0ABW4YHX4_9BACL
MVVTNQFGAVIVAAGRGTRMGTKESKQYLTLAGQPIIIHTLQTFAKLAFISEMVVVVGEHDVARLQQMVSDYQIDKVTAVIAGGTERQHSVWQGIQHMKSEWILVHDGVRPLVTPEAIATCCAAAEQNDGAAVLAVPVKDTIKQVNEQGVIIATPDRKSLWAIQTPQAFQRTILYAAHEQAQKEQFVGTDDAMIVERMGTKVVVAEGEYTNIKITTPDDLPFAELLLQTRQQRQEGEKLV